MIGKTRQESAEIEEIFDPEAGPARGILRRPAPAGKFRHSRRIPSDDLAYFIAHYWMISWDLTGCEPFTAESLPHPNVHMVFGEGTAKIYGVQSQKFVRVLEGRSQVFGVKFRPGGFRPFFDKPVSKLADGMIPAESIFGEDLKEFQMLALSAAADEEKVEAANKFFRPRVPAQDEIVDQTARLVERILLDPEIKTVEDLVSASGIAKRTLQRIFNEYVGASPKWVIRRYRLHEIIEKLNAGGKIDWAQVALELGYFDQAHLINDFKVFIGSSPSHYQKSVSMK